MPNSPVYLAIQEPCHEDWAQMTPTACGRFCQACRKEVLDFSGLAPADILAVVRSRPAGSVCGRIPVDTLAESRRQAEAAARRRPWPGAPRLRQLLAALSLPLLTAPAALASPAPTQLTPPATPAPPPRVLRVRVTDAATSAGLAFAQVTLGRRDTTLLTVQTEVDGTGRLAVPAEHWADTLRLTVELPGFPPKELLLTPAEVAGVLPVALAAGPERLPMVRKEEWYQERRTSVTGGAISMVVYEKPSLARRVVVYPPWRLYLRAKRLVQNLLKL